MRGMGDGKTFGMTDEERALQQQRDTQLLRLAARLGVEPGGDGLLTFVTGDGEEYSLVSLMHAHLDRMDAT